MADWGKILIATRLEKQVLAKFFVIWMQLIQRGLRKGDNAYVVRGLVAHKALNDIVRAFLASNCDSLLTLDSDADVATDFVETFRSFEMGWQYDILQAFYPRRGWPPRAIWLREDGLGNMAEWFVLDEATEDVSIAGTHACLFRRHVFEHMLETSGVDAVKYEWFHYPRHADDSEDAAFSKEARQCGFRIGATTAAKAGHIFEVTTTWDTYQQYVSLTGRRPLIQRYETLARLVAEFTGETKEMVVAKSLQGTRLTREAWADASPITVAETRTFYGMPDNGYLYDLLNWNCQPLYEQIIAPLRDVRHQKVLVVGAGLGTEIGALMSDTAGNAVDAFELPGVLRDFLIWSLPSNASSASLLMDETLTSALSRQHTGIYDLAVLIDVIEHIHPDEFDKTMDALARTCRAFHIHNNFGQQDTMPMHFDHSARFAAWLARHNIIQTGSFTYEVKYETQST